MHKKKHAFLYIFTGFFALLGVYGFLIEPNMVEIRHVHIERGGSRTGLAGKVALHISDLHISAIGSREEKILRLVENIEPDFIFLTGDYVKWNGDYEPALTFLSQLKAKVGIWAVMGDYDYSCSRKSCLFCHKNGTGEPTHRHSVQFLRNSTVEIRLPDGSVFLGAIDKEADRPFFSDEEVAGIGDNGPNIILAHNPLAFDLIDDDKEILMLAGDTHGGQIPLPSWLWKMLGYEKCAQYDHGLFQKGRKRMHVSKGIGTSHFPFRFGRRPEIVVLHFQ